MPPPPDSLHVYRGLPGDGLDEFIRQFSGSAAPDPLSSWLILPTERLVRTVSGRLVEKGVPFIPSRICTLQDFCRTYFEEHRTKECLLSREEARLLIGRVLAGNKDQLTIFFSRGVPSSGTIKDLQEFISVTTRRKIAYPECLLDLQGEKSDQIDTVITEYRNALRAGNLLDDDTLVAWVIDHIASGPEAFSHVFVYGLFDPLPLDQDLLLALRDHASQFTVFVAEGKDPAIFTKTSWVRDAGEIVPVSPSSPRSADLTGLFTRDATIDCGGMLRAATFPGRSREIESIAEEIARLHETGIPYRDIAIAFPDLRERIPEISEIFSDFSIPWNSAKGTRLLRFPVTGFLMGILRLVSERYPREGVVRLIGSPYFRNRAADLYRLHVCELDLVSRLAQIEGERSGWISGLDRYLARVSGDEDGESSSRPREMVTRVRDGMMRLLDDLRPLEGGKSPGEYRENFLALVDTWGLWHPPASPDEKLVQGERAALARFRHCLESLDRVPDLLTSGTVSPGEFLSIVSTITRESEIHDAAVPSGVAVLGIRECEHEHFPVLFLAGLVEGGIPSLTTRLPFSNTAENTRMGTRTLDDVLQEGRYYFLAALLAGRDRLYLSAPQSDGEKVLLSSAFFERVRERTNAVAWGSEEDGSRYSFRAASIRAGRMIADGDPCGSLNHLPPEAVIDELTGRINIERYFRRGEYDSPYEGILAGNPEIVSALASMYGPDHVYSPTVLETYAECPFRFFLERVVAIKPLPDVEPNLPAKDRGIAVHSVLTTFYRKWRAAGRDKVTVATLAEATELMLRIANEELGKHSFASPLWDATRIQMTGGGETGPGIFVRFLQQEAEEECSPLVPLHFELSFGMPADAGDDPASVPGPVELPVMGVTGEAGGAGGADGDGGVEGEGGSPPACVQAVGTADSERIRVKGRIDRIDITPEGRFSICDYKTGSVVVSKKEIDLGIALQLPLYLAAYEKISGLRGVAAGYYRIRREVENRIVLCDEAGRDLICASKPRASDIPSLLLRSQEFAAEYIRKIRAGAFPLPQKESCPNAYCEFRFICRFDPSRVFSLEEEA